MKFGLIGCGGISRIHQEQIRSIDDAKLVAVSDVSERNAKTLGEKIGVPWYTDYHEMLKRDDIDIVSIVTPSGTHGDIVIAAAQAGKHVIVEKPLDITMEKAQAAVAACRTEGVKLAVISQHRFDGSTQRVKQEISTGKFGKMVLGQAAVNWYRPQAYYDRAGWCGTWAMDGGGVLMIQALHTIDVLQYLMGPVESVYAHTATATHERIEVEDVAVATVKFKSGALGTITGTTCAYPGLSARVEIFGSLGTAVIDSDELTHLYFRDPKEEGPMFGGTATNWAHEDVCEGSPNGSKPASGASHRLQFIDMMEAIRENREPCVNGEEALIPLEIILAIYESARTGQPVTLA